MFTAENLINHTHNEVKALYCQAIITQAQWEAYDYLFGLLQFTPHCGSYHNLCKDTKAIVQDMINALPKQLRNKARIRLIEFM